MQRYDLAMELVLKSSERLKNIYEVGNIKASNKDSSGNIVTKADKEIEEFIVSGINKYFPEDIIIAEEGTGESEKKYSDAEHIWFIDPIDGTRNFASNIPFFAVSVGLTKKYILEFGIIAEPMQNIIFHAKRGEGAFKNGEPIHVMESGKIKDSLLLFGYTGTINALKISELIPKFSRTRVLGSAALNLTRVAQGTAIANIGFGFHAWDIAAGIILVQEAGGIVSDEKGRILTSVNDGDIFNTIATNGEIHDNIIKELRSV